MSAKVAPTIRRGCAAVREKKRFLSFFYFILFYLLQTTRVLYFYFYWERVPSLKSEMIPRASVLHASSVKTKRDFKQPWLNAAGVPAARLPTSTTRHGAVVTRLVAEMQRNRTCACRVNWFSCINSMGWPCERNPPASFCRILMFVMKNNKKKRVMASNCKWELQQIQLHATVNVNPLICEVTHCPKQFTVFCQMKMSTIRSS